MKIVEFPPTDVITSTFYVAERFAERLKSALVNHCAMLSLVDAPITIVVPGQKLESIVHATERTGVVLISRFSPPVHPEFESWEKEDHEKMKIHTEVTTIIGIESDSMHMLPTPMLLAEHLTKQVDLNKDRFLLNIAKRSMEHIKMCEEISLPTKLTDPMQRAAYHYKFRAYNIKRLDCIMHGMDAAGLYFRSGPQAIGEMSKIFQAVEL